MLGDITRVHALVEGLKWVTFCRPWAVDAFCLPTLLSFQARDCPPPAPECAVAEHELNGYRVSICDEWKGKAGEGGRTLQ